jgi:hypothetical protein
MAWRIVKRMALYEAGTNCLAFWILATSEMGLGIILGTGVTGRKFSVLRHLPYFNAIAKCA